MDKPPALDVLVENIPLAMRERPQWVCWRWTWKEDKQKWDKPPFDAKSGKFGSSTNRSTWSTFEVALAAYRDPRHGYSGIGYVFSGEPDDFIGIDLDHCRDPQTGEIRAWSDEQRLETWVAAPDPQQIIGALKTYAEISPSGSGVKLIARGRLNAGGKAGDFEAYRDGRYFTVTGHKLPGVPPNIAECNGAISHLERVFFCGRTKQKPGRRSKPQNHRASRTPLTIEQVVDRCRRAANSAKFERLWTGDTSDYPSQSEADLAFCSIVAFYTGPDEQLIDAIMRQSGLDRDKWDEVHGGEGRTYGQMTIAAALAGMSHFHRQVDAPAISARTFQRGELKLLAVSQRRTASKLTVQVEVRLAEKTVDLLKVSDAISNRNAAVKRIAGRLAADDVEARTWADEVLTQMLLDAGQAPKATDADPDTTIAGMLGATIPDQVRLVYRTESGRAFSEFYGEMSRAAFIERFTTNTMLAALIGASDAPVDDEGVVNRTVLLSRLEKELKLLWGDLLGSLPTIEQAAIGKDSTTAETFRAAVITCWTKLASMSLIKTRVEQKSESVQLATRCSLISRVQRMIGEDRVPTTWTPVQEGFSAWVRSDAEKKATGEIVVYLGMRWELATQVGVALPSVSNQTALRRLGEKFGVVEKEPNVSEEANRGNTRLVVLTREITDELLYLPTNEHLTTGDDR